MSESVRELRSCGSVEASLPGKQQAEARRRSSQRSAPVAGTKARIDANSQRVLARGERRSIVQPTRPRDVPGAVILEVGTVEVNLAELEGAVEAEEDVLAAHLLRQHKGLAVPTPGNIYVNLGFFTRRFSTVSDRFSGSWLPVS